MDDREGSPERITDLLQQDDYMFDDEAPTPTAAQAEHHSAQRQGSFSQAANGEPVKQSSNASKRVPIPAPPKPAGQPGMAGATPVASVPDGGPVLGPGPKRYFIIKSNSAYNIDLSVENGVWATQVGAALHAL